MCTVFSLACSPQTTQSATKLTKTLPQEWRNKLIIKHMAREICKSKIRTMLQQILYMIFSSWVDSSSTQWSSPSCSYYECLEGLTVTQVTPLLSGSEASSVLSLLNPEETSIQFRRRRHFWISWNSLNKVAQILVQDIAVHQGSHWKWCLCAWCKTVGRKTGQTKAKDQSL